MEIAEVRDRLLLSTDCRSRYRKRVDKCRYCEVVWSVGKSCPAKELEYRNLFGIKTGLDADPMDILTLAALANWQKYAADIGEDTLRAEVLEDIQKHVPADKRPQVLAAYDFLTA
jgi:hypothetical protein